MVVAGIKTILLAMLVFPLVAGAAGAQAFVQGSMLQIRQSLTGAPGIISFWSVDCPPCYKELSHWKQLKQAFPRLNLILVATDDLELQDDVEKVLREQGVDHLPSWQFADDFVQRLRYEVDPLWQGELPRTYLIAPNGDITGVSGVVDPAQVTAWLRQFDKI